MDESSGRNYFTEQWYNVPLLRTRGLKNELWTNSLTLPSLYLRHTSFSNPSVASPASQFILESFFLQPFRHFTYVTTHSLTLLSLYLRHSSFSNLSVASPTSLFILQPSFLQPFRQFTYVRTHSLTLPSLYLRHSSFSVLSVDSPTSSSFSNPSFSSPMSQDFHLLHLASRPCAWLRN